MAASEKVKPRRSYGTGSLIEKEDKNGRVVYYGKWRSNDRQVMRRIGLKRAAGSRDGLTKPQAEAELSRLIREVAATPPVGERLTLREVSDDYLRDIRRKGRKRSTLVGVESLLQTRLLPVLGDKALDRIRSEDVADLISSMEADGLSGKTIRNYAGTLSAIFNYAQRKKLVRENPVSSVDLPQAVQYADEIRFLDPEDVRDLADSVPPDPYQEIDRALYITAAMTGLRQGELIALRWQDVDFGAGRVRVRRNYVLGEFGTPKSRRSERSVPMAPEVFAALDHLGRLHGDPSDSALVFPDPMTGKPLSNVAILKRFRRALAAAHLDTAHRFHDLRHTFGTQCARQGVAMRTLQEWMGHRDVQTTQRYADYAPGHDEAEVIARAFAVRDDANLPSGLPI